MFFERLDFLAMGEDCMTLDVGKDVLARSVDLDADCVAGNNGKAEDDGLALVGIEKRRIGRSFHRSLKLRTHRVAVRVNGDLADVRN